MSSYGACAGTGKTLSLICSILQWLEDKQSVENAAPEAQSEGQGGVDLEMKGTLWLMITIWMRVVSKQLLHSSGPDIPDWLAAPAALQSVKTTSAPSTRHKTHKNAQMQNKARQRPDANCKTQDLHAAEAEHLLDAWESDTDEPAKSGKHR